MRLQVGIQIFQILGSGQILEWALGLLRFSIGCGRFFPFQLKTICEDVSLNFNLEAKNKKTTFIFSPISLLAEFFSLFS
jgi:hypothetical protein